MRKIFLLAFLFYSIIADASLYNPIDPAFKHHIFEVSITPAIDYHFLTNTQTVSNSRQSINNLYRPFMGCSFGLAYIYRPIKFFGVSAGIGFTEYVSKMGKIDPATEMTTSGMVTTIIHFKGYIQTGYLGVPIHIHGFYPVKKTMLELATGPEFSFPVYTITKYTSTSDKNIIPNFTSNRTEVNSLEKIRQYSEFGWDVQLLVNIPVKNQFYFSLGPEMKFITIRPNTPGQYYLSLPHETDYYTGIKLSFRFSTDFIPNGHSDESSSPTDK